MPILAYMVGTAAIIAAGGYALDKLGEFVGDTSTGVTKIGGIAIVGFGAYVAAKHFKVL